MVPYCTFFISLRYVCVYVQFTRFIRLSTYILLSIPKGIRGEDSAVLLAQNKDNCMDHLLELVKFIGDGSREVAPLVKHVILLVAEECVSIRSQELLICQLSINEKNQLDHFFKSCALLCANILKGEVSLKEVGAMLLLEKAAEIFTSWAIGSDSHIYWNDIIRLLTFVSVESVRVSTCKRLKRHLKDGHFFNAAQCHSAIMTLRTQVLTETHFPALKHQLHLLFLVYQTNNLPFPLDLFFCIQSLYNSKANSSVKSRCVELLGLLVRSAGLSGHSDIIEFWLQCLGECAKDENVINMRGATAVSISVSQWLHKKLEGDVSVYLVRLWLIAIRILDDDVDIVRREVCE
jgi:hypothetical protein